MRDPYICFGYIITGIKSKSHDDNYNKSIHNGDRISVEEWGSGNLENPKYLRNIIINKKNFIFKVKSGKSSTYDNSAKTSIRKSLKRRIMTG